MAKVESLEGRVCVAGEFSARRKARSTPTENLRGPIPPSAAASSKSNDSGTFQTRVDPVLTYSEKAPWPGLLPPWMKPATRSPSSWTLPSPALATVPAKSQPRPLPGVVLTKSRYFQSASGL